MRVAVRSTSWFGRPVLTDDGQVAGGHSGAVLVRRLLRLFDDPILVAEHDVGGLATGNGFDIMSAAEIQKTGLLGDTVIVNMDVLDTPDVFSRLRRTWRDAPKMMNFVWWNVSEFDRLVDRPRIALSTGLFDTFCNSVRTQKEIRDEQAKFLSPSMAHRASLRSANLGVAVEQIEKAGAVAGPRQPGRVWYPSTWLFARKRPIDWLEILEKTAAAMPVTGVMRTEPGEQVAPHSWLVQEGLLPSKQAYYESLWEYEAFVATAIDESYGLAYVEALLAGQVGVFPDRPWVWSILPPTYPLVYRDKQEAAAMLMSVLANPERARDWVVECGTLDLLRAEHDSRLFDAQFKEAVETWFSGS